VNEQPDAWAHEVGEVLDALGQPWAVAGALAALEYRAAARLTGDADVLTTWHTDLVDRLEGAGYDVRATTSNDGEYPHLLRLKRGPSSIDVLVVEDDYQQAALDRSADNHLLTIEDVLIHKVLADRARDRADVDSILSSNPELDHEYVDHWMEQWQITDLWDAARARRRQATAELDDGLDLGL
jgi:hypothetical protein